MLVSSTQNSHVGGLDNAMPQRKGVHVAVENRLNTNLGINANFGVHESCTMRAPNIGFTIKWPSIVIFIRGHVNTVNQRPDLFKWATSE